MSFKEIFKDQMIDEAGRSNGFYANIKTAEDFRNYTSEFSISNTLTLEEAEKFISKKMKEWSDHAGQFKLFFAVRSDANISIITCWESEEEDILNKYEFTGKLTGGLSVAVSKT
jgi:hypothetical protein